MIDYPGRGGGGGYEGEIRPDEQTRLEMHAGCWQTGESLDGIMMELWADYGGIVSIAGLRSDMTTEGCRNKLNVLHSNYYICIYLRWHRLILVWPPPAG